METHTDTMAHNEVKSFYLFVGIIAFAIVVLQPLAMLLVIFMQATLQA